MSLNQLIVSCVVKNANGDDVGYLNKKDIAEVVQPIEAVEN